MRLTVAVGSILAVVLLTGCGDQDKDRGPRYVSGPASGTPPAFVMAVHPLFNPTKLLQTYQPLVDLANQELSDVRFSLEASRDYATFEEKYIRKEPSILLPNPWQTLEAQKRGYHVIAMAGDPDDFRGLILVRRDSSIRVATDLKGKSVAYPSSTALAACIMPQYWLHERGIDVNSDIRNRYVGSQESSILSVALGETDAGVTWPPPWRIFQKEHPEVAASLVVLGETAALVNNSVMVRDDFPEAVERGLVRFLTGLESTERGRKILVGMETARFTSADDQDYEVVRQYVARFEAEVRLIRPQ